MDTTKKPPQSQGRKGALQEAVEYVSKAWFPVNSELLKQIQRNLEVGFYDETPQVLIEDIKKDFSLFTYCLKNIKSSPATSTAPSPVESLKQQEIDHLKKILCVSEDEISTHRFNPEDKMQAQRIKQSIVSASTAETLAEKANIDPELAFCCAELRQLGLALIAYNYPRVYGKALSLLKEHGGDLEQILFKTLGYSPTELGVTVVLDNNLNTELSLGLRTPTFKPTVNASGESTSKVTGEKLARFCSVGEMVARAGDDHYPPSPREWENAQNEINKVLGSGGLALIRARLSENGASYSSVGKDIFKFDITPPRPARAGNAFFGAKLFAENGHIKRCPPKVQEKFKAVYDHMTPGDVSIEALNILITDTIPFLGFLSGCAFLVDEQKMMLVPTVRIGDQPLSRYKPLSCSAVSGSSHPVVDALSYSSPIIQEKVFLFGDQVSHITGLFGNAVKTGVAYLEMSDDLLYGERSETLLYFKALRQCLNDCLNLRS